MRKLLQPLLSLIYIVQVYIAMAVLGLLFTPWAILSKRGALVACKFYARYAIWTAGWMLGLRTEVRGTVPTGEVLVAAKHQSFFDILVIFKALPHAKFIMKKELMWTPFIGLFAKRLGCIPVDRKKRGRAIAKMVKDVAAEFSEPGQLVIYPQGTRVAPGEHQPYKVGPAVLYEGTGYPCVPVATNVGLFWPRKGIMRYPGLGVVEFLDPIQPGVERHEFMTRLEQEIETHSDGLMAEARGGNGVH
ncbi:lysophospholipid acyltransferase family protein [Pseudodonghicola sp.]|uniref:lysophospholipid acyltransferase family protein n=1 Tax=Pseudodonghicola sp. TaxID=1969463 RepID=UPI003A977F42